MTTTYSQSIINYSLTPKAKHIISNLSEEVIFVDEDDFLTGSETLWCLYVLVKDTNNNNKLLKYTRTVESHQNENNINYISEDTTTLDEFNVKMILKQHEKEFECDIY